MQAFLGLHDIDPGYWSRLAAALGFLLACGVLAPRLPRTPRYMLAALVVILATRLILLENPWAWNFYARVLDAEGIGWRQNAAVSMERRSYQARSPVRNLAVGSSQTGAIYSAYEVDHPDDVTTFVLAAMQPFDFLLYGSYIDRERPRRVLLYLSDFDIAKRPAPEAIVIAPRQGLRIFAALARMRTLPDAPAYRTAAAELMAGEVFPELKFRFVLRGLVDEAFHRIARALGRARRERSERATQEQLIQWARESFSADYIAFNLDCLRAFIDHVTSRGVEVVIVEGHYNPIVATPEMVRLGERVRAELRGIAAGSEQVRFLPREAVRPLDADDYVDLSHVRAEVGEEIAKRVTELVDGRIHDPEAPSPR